MVASSTPRLRRPRPLLLVLALSVLGCGWSASEGEDAGAEDAGAVRDAGRLDAGADGGAGERDGGRDPGDAAVDAAVGVVDAAVDAGGAVCGPDRAPPASMRRATRCIRNGPTVDCTDFAAVFDFPPSTGIRFFQIPPDTYVALALDPGTPSPGARFDFNVEAQQTGDVPSGNLVWSISTCPGDFNRDAVIAAMGDADCFKSGPLARAGFRVGGADFAGDGNGRCGLSLPAGTTYYLNITYSDDDPVVTPGTELTWACGRLFGDAGLPFLEDICGHQIQATSVVGW